MEWGDYDDDSDDEEHGINREASLKKVQERAEPFDLLIIGGGA
jgi:hypothetical protein